VTVIVTFFNQERWVYQALDSVLNQTEQDLQLIVADDGSLDGTRCAIERWRRHNGGTGEPVLATANGGLPALLNRASMLARGRYVMVLNGDDWLDKERARHQADALDSLPDTTGVVYSDLRVVDIHGEPTGDTFPPIDQVRAEGQLLHRLITGPLFGMPCVMFRRSILDLVGAWDETLPADDFDFLLRVAAAGFEFAYLPATETNYRRYDGSMTGSRNAELAEGRIAALLKLYGRDATTNHLIDRRVHDLANALHSMGFDRSVTSRRLRWVVRHKPSRRAIRSTIESHLHIRPGRLSIRARLSGRMT
jgi:glycosyltransferase involved in cell wall biosynthesis